MLSNVSSSPGSSPGGRGEKQILLKAPRGDKRNWQQCTEVQDYVQNQLVGTLLAKPKENSRADRTIRAARGSLHTSCSTVSSKLHREGCTRAATMGEHWLNFHLYQQKYHQQCRAACSHHSKQARPTTPLAFCPLSLILLKAGDCFLCFRPQMQPYSLKKQYWCNLHFLLFLPLTSPATHTTRSSLVSTAVSYTKGTSETFMEEIICNFLAEHLLKCNDRK